MQPFSIIDWAAWTPDALNEPLTTPTTLRRRLSPLAQHAMQAAWSLKDATNARIVFASRNGEYKRTMSMLEAITVGEGVSPADFTLNVHHALTGLLSIAQQNRHGHIAVAAGTESFCYGFLEALACLNETPETPVLLIYCDEPLPAIYESFNEPTHAPIALAILMGATGGDRYEFTLSPAPKSASISDAHAHAFLNFLKTQSAILTSHGERTDWQWVRHAAA